MCWGILKRWISDEKHKRFNYRKRIEHYGCWLLCWLARAEYKHWRVGGCKLQQSWKLQAQLTPVSGLVAGPHKGDEAIAILSASGSSKQYVVTGDYSKPETVGNNSDVWTVIGKSGNTIKITFGGVACGSKGSLVDGASHKWWIYNMTDKVAVKLFGSQTVKADTYPVTIHIAEYQA